MAEGKDTYMGLGVPLFGCFEIQGRSTSLDLMTLTAAGGGTGDFIVCQNSAGTEMFVVEDDGATTVGGGGVTITSGGLTVTAGGATITAGDLTVTAGDVSVGDGYYLRFAGTIPTTAVTTGLTQGDFYAFEKGNVYSLGFVVDGSNTTWTVALTNN